MNKSVKRFGDKGFTIVELLIVIVVIGVLAAIVMVSYVGTAAKADKSSMVSDLSNNFQQLKIFQTQNDNENYPTTINCGIADSSTNKCIKNSGNATYSYVSSVAPKSFCLTVTKNNQSYNIDQDHNILAGPCPVLNLDAGNSLSYTAGSSTWYDLSGYGHNGTLTGGVSYDNANSGSLVFDGVDDWVSGVTHPAVGATPNVFTISGFIYPDNQLSRFITPASNGNDQFLSYDPTTRRLFVAIAEAANTNERSLYSPTGSVPLNTWTYWAVSISDKSFKMYINGILVLESNQSISIANWSNGWSIGQRGTSTFWYKGKMGRIMVHNQVLSTNDVKQNYDTLKGRYGL